MRTFGFVLVVLALLCGAFAFWGMSTESGRRRFDEMAGLIPMGAGLFASVLAIVGVILLAFSRK